MKINPIIAHTRGVHTLTLPALNPSITNLALTVRLGVVHPHTGIELELLAELLQTGTAKKDKAAFEMYLKQHGIILHITATAEGVHFFVRVPTEHTTAAVRILEEIIFSPLLLAHECKAKKQTALEQNREAYDDAKLITEINFTRLILPKDSPYTLPSLTERTALIKHASKARLSALLTRLHNGEWYLSTIGNQEALAACKRLVRRLQKTAAPVPLCTFEVTPAASQQHFETVPGKTNVEIIMGNRLPLSTRDEEYVPFLFGLAVLGKVGGFSGRLMSTVREKEGLTYGIYATTKYETQKRTGIWKIFTFFTARDLNQGIASTLRELNTIVKKGILEDELITFKAIIENQFIMAHGSDWSRLNLYHHALLADDTTATLTARLTATANLTSVDVHDALRKFIDPQALIISGAGPVDAHGRPIL